MAFSYYDQVVGCDVWVQSWPGSQRPRSDVSFPPLYVVDGSKPFLPDSIAYSILFEAPLHEGHEPFPLSGAFPRHATRRPPPCQ